MSPHGATSPQLEQLHSEDIPSCPMITHTIDQFILDQVKTRQSKLQIERICQNFAFFNFEKNFTHDTF